MVINKETVKYLANLSRIELTEEDVDSFTGHLESILEYVHKLEKLDVSQLEPTSHVLKIKNAYREDVVKKSLPIEDVIKNVPAKQDNLFKVPKII